ncbi:hypothetical protein ACQKPX_08770 [Photobacterium sp. DNB23_23_1]|nr:hypothetical protein [Photobacterium sp. ZSDE20]
MVLFAAVCGHILTSRPCYESAALTSVSGNADEKRHENRPL